MCRELFPIGSPLGFRGFESFFRARFPILLHLAHVLDGDAPVIPVTGHPVGAGGAFRLFHACNPMPRVPSCSSGEHALVVQLHI